MATQPWKTSLPLYLSLVLGAAIAIFWLLSASVALFFDFRDNRQIFLKRLGAEAFSHMQKKSAKLRGIESDVKGLLRSWQAVPDTIYEHGQYLVAHYITTGRVRSDSPARLSHAKAFVEAYGGTAVGNVVDTFVLLDGGYVVAGERYGFEWKQAHELHNLAKRYRSPAKDYLIWGTPYRMDSGEWRLSVAGKDGTSGAVVGVTIRLSTGFVEQRMDEGNDLESFWLDANGHPLTTPSTPLLENIHTALPSCDPSSPQSVRGMQVICSRVEPTGWRLLYAYPEALPTEQALSRLPMRVLVAVVTLLGLIGIFYIVLQRSLGRTLARFVQTITPRGEVGDQQRLLTKREDELGQIARAYNRLLDAVQTQYAVLEAKVVERTAQLDDARCRAELASANKSEQLTSISHEIRTPLNGVIGALILLNRTPRNTDQDNLVDTALKCANHLLEIINNLLDFSRIESGQMVVAASMHDPLPLIDQAMLTVQLPALEKRLALRTEISASFPSVLQTDGLRLRQILINLLGNAVKFTAEGGVTLRAWFEDEKVYFSVQDTGQGIPVAWHAEAFTAFKQMDGHVSGSGLGLAIARSLARLLGGDLYLVVVDHGTCFQLELPCRARNPITLPDRTAIVAPIHLHPQLHAWGYRPIAGNNPALDAPELVYLPGKLRERLQPDAVPYSVRAGGKIPVSAWALQLLVVDDVDTNRDIVGRMLRLLGHVTYEAVDGKQALEMGRSQVFDAVLMDMRMPGLSGEDTVSLWRDEANGMLDPDCPIIALTANAMPSERARLLNTGFNEYLTKPVTPAMLARALEFAADLQLSRGMELAPSPVCELPVLAGDSALLPRLGAELRHYCQRLQEAMAIHNVEEIRSLLHTLKGLAGQAGLTGLHEMAQQLEQRLGQDGALPPDALHALRSFIEDEPNVR